LPVRSAATLIFRAISFSTAAVVFDPSLSVADIVYVFPRNHSVFVVFATGELVKVCLWLLQAEVAAQATPPTPGCSNEQVDPTSGAILSTVNILTVANDPTARLTLGSTFDAEGGFFYSNAISVVVSRSS
jgi:hypothetical protein